MKKQLPDLKTDEEAEEFVANSDLTEYDLSGLRRMTFEFEPKTAQVNLRVPSTLLASVKDEAAALGVPYTRFIRMALERAVAGARKSAA